MQRKYGIQVWILLTETNEIVKSALQTIRCKEKIRFFRGHQEKTGASEDEKNSILKGKPRIPPIVSSWCVHGRKTRCDLLPQEQARLQPAGTHRQCQAGVCGEKKPHQAFVS